MCLESLRQVLIESQDSQNPNQLVKAFSQIYHSVPFEEFWPAFLYLLKHPLLVYERETTVEKTIEFISKAVTDLAIKASQKSKKQKTSKDTNQDDGDDAETDEEEEEDMHPLLMKVFEFLLEVHSAKERGVRFRVCQLVTRLLHNLGEGAKIDDALYDQIYRSMVERLRDKCPLVRVHAVLALTRLQDPTDDECPITKAYLILMSRDPNVEVRRIILTSIAPSSVSLPGILERTHDVKDTVRRTAYTVLAEKVPFRALKIEQRIQLLQDGLNDRSEMVKSVCSSKLLQAWLCACEGNVLDLLERLDVHSSPKICETALKILFKNSGVMDLVEKFDIIDERAFIPVEKLKCESAFYWRNLIQFVHGSGNEYEEQLDKIRPNCVQFCEYLKKVASQLASCPEFEEMLDLEFIIQQLLKILTCMDLSDQASRKATETCLYQLLAAEHVGPSLVEYVLPCLQQLYVDVEALTQRLVETISEIREPITTQATEMSATDRRQLDKKIAGIRVKLNQLREELGQCVEEQNFERAAEIKACISNLDAERSSLLEDAEPQIEEVRTQKNDPLTILKCLTIACELLTTPGIRTLSPALQTLMESQILPGMVNEEAEVRNAAVRAIGLCCLLKKDIIMQHLPLLLQATQMDTPLVRCSALKSIFDLVHVFGLDAFSDSDNTATFSENKTATLGDDSCIAKDNAGDESSGSMNDSGADDTKNSISAEITSASITDDKKTWSEAAGKVIAILSTCLDSENTELRSLAVEGMAKLLLSGRLVSPKLLSHLLLLWYNPLVEEDVRLLQCLGVFFPLFAFSSSENQELIEEAFVPTLKTLLQAPNTSPLAEVNEVNVANFLVELTSSQHLAVNQNSEVKENPCHDSLAVKLCNEIISQPDSFHTRLWLRVLGQLHISEDNLTLLKDLDTMCDNMATVVTEKQCVKLFEKFRAQVKARLDELELRLSATMDKDKTLSEDQEKESSETTSSDSVPESIIQDISSLEISHRGDKGESTSGENVSTAAQSAKKTRVKTTKTPARSTQGFRSAKSSHRKTNNTSILEDSVFATPAPLKGSRLTAEIEDTRVNLENLLVDGKTPSRGKTPKTPKRPLHSIQDPAFTG